MRSRNVHWLPTVAGVSLVPGPVELSIADLRAGSPADWSHLDQAKVNTFVRLLASLPPVVVFRTERGLLLVDGYHRVEAALRAGRVTVPAVVIEGSTGEALRHAARVGAVEMGVSEDEALRRILTRYSPPQADR